MRFLSLKLVKNSEVRLTEHSKPVQAKLTGHSEPVQVKLTDHDKTENGRLDRENQRLTCEILRLTKRNAQLKDKLVKLTENESNGSGDESSDMEEELMDPGSEPPRRTMGGKSPRKTIGGKGPAKKVTGGMINVVPEAPATPATFMRQLWRR
ncbi:unnamed protein product [Clonostachys solani]|uniref:Uncharacterized protein n=1 Tax=Clonostachys solani TaxID=160281 RepID=A0A9N9YZC3_9HYPO|nr:unnamed protein product [Clonostachys solani]